MDSAYIHEVASAIRKNGLKQAFHTWHVSDDDGNIIQACVLGQAGINMGMHGGVVMTKLDSAGATHYECPSKAKSAACNGSLGGIVMHLNDDHRWKFSSIANWLDKVADNG